MRKWLKRAAIVIGVLVMLLVGSWAWTLFGPTPPLEVGPETTVLTGPLRDDGTVDYLAALNERFSEGVTPENNAFVVIAELTAPDAYQFALVRPTVFEMLGVAMPADGTDHFKRIAAYAERRAAEDEQGPWTETIERESESPAGTYHIPRWAIERDRALEGPWSRDDAPLVAEWLADQQWVLDRLCEGLRRERYWSPYIVNDEHDLVVDVLVPLHALREMSRGLTARALHRLQQGDFDGAIGDVLALKRLSRHLGRMATLTEHLMGVGVSTEATKIAGHIAGHEAMTAERARALRADLAALSGRFSIADALDYERFMTLDYLQRPWLAEWQPLTVAGRMIDTNRAMKRSNGFYDRIVEAAAAPTRAERTRQFAAVRAELDALADHVLAPSTTSVGLLAGHRRTITDTFADLLVGIMPPSLDRISTVVDRAEMLDHLALAALAVAGHRAEHGEYPPTLDALVPDWLDAVPADLFDPEPRPIRYRVDGHRVVIYSIGRNEQDNGGLDDPDEGDVVIEWRIP